MQVAEGIEWKNVYWVSGTLPSTCRMRNAVTDPPTSGWQHAFIIVGEKRSTILCPYSLSAYTVPNTCEEVAGAREASGFRADFLRETIEQKWAQLQAYGFQRDYDTVALLMKRMGWDVPPQVMTGGGADDRKRGGKETGARLLKPVRRKSKRGRFLEWFLEGNGSRSVREAMAEFGMTRSNALSYLYMIQKDHGIGYVLVGDVATVTLPDGCDDPFDGAARPAAKPDEAPRPATEDTDGEDDSWLC
jgi:hypothetical protein